MSNAVSPGRWLSLKLYARGVGQDEDPFSDVRGASVSGAQLKRQAGVPDGSEVAPHDGHPPTKGRRAFDDRVLRLRFREEASEMEPEPGSFAGEPAASARGADVLAREPPADEIDRFNVPCAESSHVGIARHVGPVLSQDGAGVVVGLALPDDSHPGSLEAEIDSADTGEE